MSAAPPSKQGKKEKPAKDVADAAEQYEGTPAAGEVSAEQANDAATGAAAANAGGEDGEASELVRYSFDSTLQSNHTAQRSAARSQRASEPADRSLLADASRFSSLSLLFCCAVLANIKTAQMTNGLRHGDHQRYRQYCSRRLRRIRVGLDCTQSKREFKPQAITPATVTDVRYLALVLVQAERSWAYAMQLKNDMTAETQRKRFHLLKRLTKAAQSAKLLVELCAARADTRTQLQAEAYSAWLSASVLFERNAHDKALALFLHAKEVYDKLGSIGGSSMQILCEERVANLQDSIRFSKYMLRHKAGAAAQEDDADDASIGELAVAGGNELLAAKLETLRQEKLMQQAQSLDTVEWQGKTVPVSSEKLRLSFVEARNLKQQLDKALETVNAAAASAASASSSSSSAAPAPESKDPSSSSEEAPNLSSLFQRLFGCYDDALKVLRDALLEPKMLEAHKAHLLALQQYATAQRLEVQIQRNQNFVSNLVAQLQQQEAHPKAFAHRRKTKPDEAVVLYEKLLANLTELNEIAQANKNQSESKMLTLRATATKALRVFFLAESYRRIRKFTESYLLYSRALETAEEFEKLAAKSGAEAETAAVTADRARMQTLKREALNLRGQVHAQALLASAEASAKVAQSAAAAQNVKIGGEGGAAVVVSVAPPALTLATRLDQYDAGEVGAQYALLDFPPSFQSAPAKPILFDLAFNAISYPDISARAAQKKAAPAPAAAAAAAAPAPAAKQTQAQKAPAAAASAAASAPAKQPTKATKQPEPEPEEEEEEEEEQEESEEESPSPAPAAAKPAAKPASAPAAKKVIAPPGESKADKAARERREKEEAEKARLKAEAEAAKKGGWGLGGLVGKMFGR